VSEVDAPVRTPLGSFLIEIKSRRDELSGGAHTWTWKQGARLYTEDNPFRLSKSFARVTNARQRSPGGDGSKRR